MSVLFSFVHFSQFFVDDSLKSKIMIGILFGVASAVVMFNPIIIPQGATFDTRGGPAMLVAIFGGPISTIIASIIGAAARLQVGGGSAIGGAASFLFYGLAGLGAMAGLKRYKRKPDIKFFLITAVFGTICVLPAFFIGQSFELGITILQKAWWMLLGGNIAGVIVLGFMVLNMTERKVIEQKLERRSEALNRSNKDLERFAYVASHDLQEPLRAVASYTQLLANRYEGKLDAKADKYIRHANEGALRMKRLIDGLLVFSRINSQGGDFTLVDCNRTIEKVLKNLEVIIAETKAEIVVDELPTLVADEQQLAILFQNLLSNALKFRGDAAPLITLKANSSNEHWLFSVTDNGIGMDPKFAERVFVIFQRLHTRTEFPGDGLGLSICKQIVERHNGDIWVESLPSKGATFYIKLKANGYGRNLG
ncbi:MAG: ATP-binding protein [Alphaproteobacteria bacterium]|nr:ATP-binding protein [Rhodospirillales bacterium]MCW9046426.1 ATP-binding protein [Alphaproteobacteria bacterium]